MGKSINNNNNNNNNSNNSKKKRKHSSGGGGVSKSNTSPANNSGGPTKKSSSSSSSSAAATTTPSQQTKIRMKNPLLDRQAQFLSQSTLTDEERHEIFSPSIPSERRAELWMDQADLGQDLVNRYAWATPNPTAIRILNEFSPLVEIGCGSNAYWCTTLRQAGIDILGYDINIAHGGKIIISSEDIAPSQMKPSKHNAPGGGPSSYFVKQGGPDVLASKELQTSGRTLFLCYPDEDVEASGAVDVDEEDDLPTSMGWQCLHHYSGEHVIHVGETFLDANYGMDQAPWGRSSAPEFQQRLASEFHCILKVELPNWLHTRDTLSVWKRSTISTMVFAADDDDDDDEEEEDEEVVEYRHVPRSERLPVNMAAPCLAHLLPSSTGSKGSK